jgi:hypothetical protein
VLGTAILVAIVGDPGSLAKALDVSNAAYLFAVIAALASGAVALALRPLAKPESGPVAGGQPAIASDS